MSLVVEDLFVYDPVFFINGCFVDSCDLGVLMRGGEFWVFLLCHLGHSLILESKNLSKKIITSLLCKFGYKTFIRYMFCEYFLPWCDLLFYFLNGDFEEQDFLLMKVKIIFSYIFL